ncbi:MarR family transcriptional regulator, partial [Flavonifractor plautii]
MAERTGSANSTVSGIVDRLEKLGLARRQRSETDRPILPQHREHQGLGKGQVQPAEVAAELLGHVLCHPQIGHKNIGLFHRSMLPPVTRIHRTASAHGLGGKALEDHG